MTMIFFLNILKLKHKNHMFVFNVVGEVIKEDEMTQF